jgi:RNA-directed DNA polymerase
MQSRKVMRQMLGQPGLAGRKPGEAGCEPASDETGGTLHEHPGTGSARSIASTGGLLEAALTRQNLQAAWQRVKANKGAAGADGLDIEATAASAATADRPQLQRTQARVSASQTSAGCGQGSAALCS